MTIQNRLQPITRSWLEEQDAWGDDLDTFTQIFGDSAELTRANLARIAAAEFNINWLANHILAVTPLQAYLNAKSLAFQDYKASQYAAEQAYAFAKATALADALGLPSEEQPQQH